MPEAKNTLLRLPLDKSKENITKILLNLLDLYEPGDGDQTMMVYGNRTDIDAHKLAIVSHMGAVPKEISADQRYHFLSEAIRKLVHRPKEEQTVDQLYLEMNALIDTGKPITVSVLTFIKIDNQTAPNEFQIGNTIISKAERHSYREFTQSAALAAKLGYVGKSDIRRNVESKLSLLTPYQYNIKIGKPRFRNGKIYGKEYIVEPFERLRSLINFATTYGRRIEISSLGPMPKSPVVTSPLWFFKADDEIIDDLMYVPSAFDFPSMVTNKWDTWDGLPIFNKLLADAGADEVQDGTIRNVVWKMLSLYQEGLDSTDSALALLHLWQVIERATFLSADDGRAESKQIINKLKLLLAFPGLKEYPITEVDKSALSEIADLRNSFAHSGDFPRSMGASIFR